MSLSVWIVIVSMWLSVRLVAVSRSLSVRLVAVSSSFSVRLVAVSRWRWRWRLNWCPISLILLSQFHHNFWIKNNTLSIRHADDSLSFYMILNQCFSCNSNKMTINLMNINGPFNTQHLCCMTFKSVFVNYLMINYSNRSTIDPLQHYNISILIMIQYNNDIKDLMITMWRNVRM